MVPGFAQGDPTMVCVAPLRLSAPLLVNQPVGVMLRAVPADTLTDPLLVKLSGLTLSVPEVTFIVPVLVRLLVGLMVSDPDVALIVPLLVKSVALMDIAAPAVTIIEPLFMNAPGAVPAG